MTVTQATRSAVQRALTEMEEVLERDGWDQPPMLLMLYQCPLVAMPGSALMALEAEPFPVHEGIWGFYGQPSRVLEALAEEPELTAAIHQTLSAGRELVGIVFAVEVWWAQPTPDQQPLSPDVPASEHPNRTERRLVYCLDTSAAHHMVSRIRGTEKVEYDLLPSGGMEADGGVVESLRALLAAALLGEGRVSDMTETDGGSDGGGG